MPTADFFSNLGIFFRRNFLEREFCREIKEELKKASDDSELVKPGVVWMMDKSSHALNEEIKRVRETQRLSPQTISKVRKKLLEIMPEVASHFSTELSDCQQPKFSLYQKGDFYSRHIDVFGGEDVSPIITSRKVSTIIFLNDETIEPTKDSYCGGNLTFYGLMKNSAFGNFGLPLIGECGMMIAFEPNIIHEVTPVTQGERFVIVNWFV